MLHIVMIDFPLNCFDFRSLIFFAGAFRWTNDFQSNLHQYVINI